MGTLYKPGFTIIETMLFLAITGLMVVGLLAGSGASINQQRYRDAVASFQSSLQQQYSDVVNVHNDRERLACQDAQVVEAGTPTYRGQSDCLLMGRYMVVQGGAMSTTDVLGFYSGEAPRTIEAIAGMDLSLYGPSTQTSAMEWDTAIAWPAEGLDEGSGDRTLAVLILSSPANGGLYTFTADSDVGSGGLNAMVTLYNYETSRVVCVNPSGLFTGANLAIVIQPYASSTTAITLRSNDTAGDGQKC